MRLSEQYSLTWEQIDFSRKEINLEQTKNGSARSIPMDRDVLHAFEILYEMDRPTSPSSRVFPIQSPRYWFARIATHPFAVSNFAAGPLAVVRAVYGYIQSKAIYPTQQQVVVDAPIDTLPLFVRAGSIVPLGSKMESAQQPQKIASIRVYLGANGSFTLFREDGNTYAYEKGKDLVTKLTWDDSAHRLKHKGAKAWSELDQSIVTLIKKQRQSDLGKRAH